MSDKQRRPRGEGSIYQDTATGRWIGLYNVGGPGGARQRKKVTGRTKTEVSNRLKELRKAQESGVDLTGRPTTVGEVARLWLEQGAPSTKGRKSEATLSRLTERIERHLIPGLGDLRIDALRHEHIEAWLAAEAKGGRIDAATGKPRGQSRATLADYRKDIAQVVTWAKRRRYIGADAIDMSVVFMPAVAASAEKRTLSPEEAQRVLVACADHRLGTYFAMMLRLGMRPGEVDALRWSDLDLDAGSVRIERALKRGSGGAPLSIGTPKTDRSRRTLGLPAGLVSMLRSRRTEQIADRLRNGPYWTTDERWSDLVFTTEVGTPFYSSNLRREFAAICKKAKAPAITPYELRHSAASLYVEQGFDLVQVADLLGHTDTRMLDRHYRHKVAEIVTLAADADEFGTAAEA
jgi:integrase